MARKYTTEILETECIGNSLLTINNNFLNLDTKTADLTAGLISTNTKLLSSFTEIAKIGGLQTRTTNIETSAAEVADTYVPLYCIIMYAGQGASSDFDAMTGRGLNKYRKFALCNGNSHTVTVGGSTVTVTTPNLMDRFIIGGKPAGVISTGTRNLGALGGQETVTLALSELPAHNHVATFTGTPLAGHNHTYHGPDANYATLASSNNIAGYVTAGGAGQPPDVTDPFETSDPNRPTSSNSAGTPAGTVTVNNEGGGAAHTNMPPFYALAFIMRIE